MRLMLALVLFAATDQAPIDLPASLQTLLTTRKLDATPPSFRLIALSNLADGCVGQTRAKPGSLAEGQACTRAALKLALATKPNRHGLHLTHLKLIYGAVDALVLSP